MAIGIGDGECECCGFWTKLRRYEYTFAGKPVRRDICDLCNATDADSPMEFLDAAENRQQELLQKVCYIGNAIIREIRSR